jgi:membrane protease YdiL (CAAX protease family)
MEYIPETEPLYTPMPEPKRTRRAASLCAFAAITATLLSYAILFVYGILTTNAAFGDRMSANLMLLVNMAAVDFFAMPIAWLLFLRRIPKNDACEIETRTPLTLKKLLFFLPCVFALMYAGALMGTLIGMLFKKGLSNVVEQAIGSVDVWVSVLCAGIIGPVAEELFFRKAMIDRLSKFHPTDAILFSALLFGLIHGNLTQFLYAFPLGILLGIIYYRTQNIGYTILLHIAINTIGGVVPQLVGSAVAGLPEEIGMLVMLVYSQIIIGICAVGLVFLIRRRREFLPIRSNVPRFRRPFYLNVGFIVACVIFTGLFVLSEIAL